MPQKPGLQSGRLAPCPRSPNCINTFAEPTDAIHYAPPLALTESAPSAITRVRGIIEAMPRTRIVTAEPVYLHATFTSKIFRWVDDVEVYADGAAGRLHFRSASRVGKGDLGVNRRRINELMAAYLDQAPTH